MDGGSPQQGRPADVGVVECRGDIAKVPGSGKVDAVEVDEVGTNGHDRQRSQERAFHKDQVIEFVDVGEKYEIAHCGKAGKQQKPEISFPFCLLFIHHKTFHRQHRAPEARADIFQCFNAFFRTKSDLNQYNQ